MQCGMGLALAWIRKGVRLSNSDMIKVRQCSQCCSWNEGQEYSHALRQLSDQNCLDTVIGD
jgi:hypothetical protein